MIVETPRVPRTMQYTLKGRGLSVTVDASWARAEVAFRLADLAADMLEDVQCRAWRQVPRPEARSEAPAHEGLPPRAGRVAMAAPKGKWTLLTYKDIAAYRERNSIRSDAELAEALEVSVGSIAGWKKGVRAPSARVQRQLALKVFYKKKTSPKTGCKDLVKRLLALASEVKDPTPLIDASAALLST